TPPDRLGELARQLVAVGTEPMDLYPGRLSPRDLAGEIVAQLRADGRLDPDAFAAWVAEADGYRLVEVSDGSRWTLRAAAGSERYVHAHPGRYSPQSLRVRANVLKTAVMVLADARANGGHPPELERVNAGRKRYLDLRPA